MNVKKLVKKIAAVGTGALLVSSAFAASLSEWPMPFVTENGQGDVQFVIGDGSTSDYLGAIDIAVALQASAVSESSVNTEGTTAITVEGGIQLDGGTGDYLIFDEDTAGQAALDSDDLPALLADGTLSDDDGKDASDADLADEETDYEQTLDIGAMDVFFGTPEDEEMPIVYLRQDAAAYSVVVEFDDAVDFEAREDGESIEIMGRTFTIGKDTTSSTLVLFGSDATTLLDLNEPVTVEQNGKSYTVEIVGANSEGADGESIILDVNGVRKTLLEDATETINGLDVFVKDLFVTNIPTLSASANIFIGSDEIKLTDGELIEVDGVDLDGYEFSIDAAATDLNDVTTMTFTFTPGDLDNDEDHYLTAGESMVDPFFGTFKLDFAGMSQEFDSSAKIPVEVEVQGDDEVLITVVNDKGDEFTISAYEDGLTNANLVLAGNVVEEDQQFLGQDGDNTALFEVTSIKSDDTEVTIKNLVTGESKVYEVGDAVKDTQYFVGDIDDVTGVSFVDAADGVVGTDDEAVQTTVTLKDGSVLTLVDDTVADTDVELTIVEDNTDFDTAGLPTGTLGITPDYTTADDEFVLKTTTKTNFEEDTDEDGNKYGLSDYGTYYTLDEDGIALKAYIPDEAEVEYNVFIAPVDAAAVVSGGSSAVTTQRVNAFSVGAAIKDVDVNVANPANNLIVIGGTCINSVSAELKEVAAGSCGADSGLSPNEAIVELFTLDNGKVAMLVAGYEAVDTQAASRAVATGKIAEYDKNAVKLTVTSASNYQLE